MVVGLDFSRAESEHGSVRVRDEVDFWSISELSYIIDNGVHAQVG